MTKSVGLLAGSLFLALASPSFAQSYGGVPYQNAPSAATTRYDRMPTGSINGSYYQGRTQRGGFEANSPSRGLGDLGAAGAPGAGGAPFGSD